METYLELSIGLFKSLFGFPPTLQRAHSIQTKTGLFLQLWNNFEYGLRKRLPPKDTFAYHWKRDYLGAVNKEAASLYDSVSRFRNELVHGLSKTYAKDIEAKIIELKKLAAVTGIDIDKELDD